VKISKVAHLFGRQPAVLKGGRVIPINAGGEAVRFPRRAFSDGISSLGYQES
jgi:hypothetical protein